MSMLFTWDENKRIANLKKHGLDLSDSVRLFDGRFTHTYPSRRDNEARFVTVGIIDDVFVAIIWTQRDDTIRLISMRRARHGEKRAYYESLV
jgi:uncharacterized DUF497 family protein